MSQDQGGLKLDSNDVIAVLAELIGLYGPPQYVRSDNGGEFIAGKLKAWLQQQGSATLHVAPGQPWENGYTESFNGKFREAGNWGRRKSTHAFRSNLDELSELR